MISAVFFDFGGVILSSPFEAFAAYESRVGLPVDTIRSIHSTEPDTNAWARLERGELGVEQFVSVFEREAAALGHRVDGNEVIACLHGEIRPAMVEALRRCKEHFATALLTNNFVTGTPEWSSGGSFAELVPLFDVIVESSSAGCRKPEPSFYEIALEQLGVDASQVVFLDDLGINLKPARALGMTTIKVGDPEVAIRELEQVVGIALR
ncbi:HAD-IA family hydrolase [soil metagenome]